MAQLTVYTPDNSIADVLAIPDELALEFTDILENLDRNSLDLTLLRKIKNHGLSIVLKSFKEQGIQVNNPQEIQDLAISTIDWFASLLDVIQKIKKLPNPDSLTIFVND